MMMLAVANLTTNTDIPSKVVDNIASPLIDTYQMENIFITASETKVELNTVGTQPHLIGGFKLASMTTTKADTQILCICRCAESEQSHDCDNDFFHVLLFFNVLNVICDTFLPKIQMQRYVIFSKQQRFFF